MISGAFKLLNLLTKTMNAFGTIGIFFIMMLIVSDVFLRAVFSHPIIGVPEIIKLSIVTIVFLQAAHTLSVGRFTSSDIFLLRIEKASPIFANILRTFFNLCGAFLFGFVAIGALDQMNYAYEGQDFVGSQGIFTIPTWPVHAAILFGSTILAIQFCANAAIVWETNLQNMSEDIKLEEENI